MVNINYLIAQGLLYFFQILYIILFARIILSWFVMGSGGGSSKTLMEIYNLVFGLTEPLLAPLRKVLPSVRLGMGYLDLSPIILLIILRAVQSIIAQYL